MGLWWVKVEDDDARVRSPGDGTMREPGGEAEVERGSRGEARDLVVRRGCRARQRDETGGEGGEVEWTSD
nr:hypothetical protein CFP56_04451 [Quercus suber]